MRLWRRKRRMEQVEEVEGGRWRRMLKQDEENGERGWRRMYDGGVKVWRRRRMEEDKVGV